MAKKDITPSEEYASLDAKRKAYEAELADQEDLKFLEDLEEQIRKNPGKKQ